MLEAMPVRLVVLEAWNISRFLSVTNKRREIAGASELITYLDRRWVGEALARLHPGFTLEWRIETHPIELLETGAGSAKVLVQDAESARALVTDVTLAALRLAPGLEVTGVVGEPFDWGTPSALHGALREAQRALEPVRTSLPGPDARFLRLPMVDECASTGLPAASLSRLHPGEREPRSAESLAKWRAYGREDEGDGLGRLAALAGTEPWALKSVVQHLAEKADWVGVVYADGNGLGDVFGRLDACVTDPGNRCYADTLRSFSAAVQDAARAAFAEAVESLREQGAGLGQGAEGPVPVLPLILGGDDLVAICEGAWALPFTAAYLSAFERHTAGSPQIADALTRREKGPGLSACAGVAIVKAHFPFAVAHTLAYDLMTKEAKKVKDRVPGVPCSALSFHVLYDSSDADLARIRLRQTVAGPETVCLTAQPYVVSDLGSEPAWVEGRRWSDLLHRVGAVAARGEEGERLLPVSQLHDLREALFLGREVADGRLGNLRARYSRQGLEDLLGGRDSLFWRSSEEEPWTTGLLDAMDAERFLSAGVFDVHGVSR
ncbi:Cas10/Cmr2 second palm domain-containing protein [Streptomyces cadmiisoli]|uniref:Cas10/Cmr2 second palm domain-containing protein n=1 Tax=Streptomyces cadmiisoli TaxID=2184053 RepID=UPI00364A4C63